MTEEFSLEGGPENDGFKTSFDGRVMYYKVMGRFLLAWKISALQGDLQSWYRGTRVLFGMCHAYMAPAKQREIREALKNLRGEISLYGKEINQSKRAFVGAEIERKLLELDEQMHEAAKEIFLPVKSANIEGWDDEDFERRSDS